MPFIREDCNVNQFRTGMKKVAVSGPGAEKGKMEDVLWRSEFIVRERLGWEAGDSLGKHF